MTDSIRVRQMNIKHARHQFVVYTLLWFALAFALGALVALAEHRLWLPCRVSLWFDLPTDHAPSLLAVIGLCISQTIYVPALFFAGLHRIGYHYTSRLIFFAFWFFHGVDAWKFLFAMHQNAWREPLILVVMLFVVACMGYFVLRIHSIAAAGIALQAASCALRPTAYIVQLVQYWGAVLLLQAFFYVCYIWIS